METREVAIEVKDVKKVYKLYDRLRDRMYDALGFRKNKYKLHYALNGVNLNIYKGETVGIIGTNGSGKSTILKIITGVLSPSEGEVKVNGRISALLELGAGFNQEYNGIENIYLNGTMMGFSEKEIDAKLPAILEFADIGEGEYGSCLAYELAVVQVCIEAALRQQAVVVTLFDDVAVLHHQNDIGLTDGGQSVCYDKAGSALHHPGECILYLDFRTGINGGGCLVQNQHGR